MSDPGGSEQQEREQEQSLALIEQGGIPLSAQRRLSELRRTRGADGAGGGSGSPVCGVARHHHGG